MTIQQEYNEDIMRIFIMDDHETSWTDFVGTQGLPGFSPTLFLSRIRARFLNQFWKRFGVQKKWEI